MGSGFSAAAEVLLAAGGLAFSRDGTAAGLLATAEVDAAGDAAALEDSGGSGKVGVGFAGAGSARWPLPLAAFELENHARDDRVAYALSRGIAQFVTMLAE